MANAEEFVIQWHGGMSDPHYTFKNHVHLRATGNVNVNYEHSEHKDGRLNCWY